MARDVLGELARLVRSFDGEARNVAGFLVEHAPELAPLLHTSESDLRNAESLTDEVVVRALRPRLERALDAQRAAKREQASVTASRAALDIGRTARWHERGVVLDEDLVLGPLLADTRTKHVAFALPTTTITLDASLLRRARILRNRYLDLVCFVDETGLHLRWRGGRGALNLVSQRVTPTAERVALLVPIPPPVRHQLPAFAGVAAESIGAH